ncbi:hypothetical protein ACFQOZ_08200 [Comamonas endophytica]
MRDAAVVRAYLGDAATEVQHA